MYLRNARTQHPTHPAGYGSLSSKTSSIKQMAASFSLLGMYSDRESDLYSILLSFVASCEGRLFLFVSLPAQRNEQLVLIQIILQLFSPGRVFQFPQRLCLDLSYS